MKWTKCSFVAALKKLVEGFQSSPDYDCLALVWREGNEYRVMQSWEVNCICKNLRSDRLRVVLWLDRVEAGIVLTPSVGAGR